MYVVVPLFHFFRLFCFPLWCFGYGSAASCSWFLLGEIYPCVSDPRAETTTIARLIKHAFPANR